MEPVVYCGINSRNFNILIKYTILLLNDYREAVRVLDAVTHRVHSTANRRDVSTFKILVKQVNRLKWSQTEHVIAPENFFYIHDDQVF